MKDAKEFLDLCSRRFPPPRKDLKHSLCLEDGMLVLTLVTRNHASQRINLTDDDLGKRPAQLLAELIVLVQAPEPPKTA